MVSGCGTVSSSIQWHPPLLRRAVQRGGAGEDQPANAAAPRDLGDFLRPLDIDPLELAVRNEADVRGMERGGMDDRVGALGRALEQVAVGEIAGDAGRRERHAIDPDHLMLARTAREKIARPIRPELPVRTIRITPGGNATAAAAAASPARRRTRRYAPRSPASRPAPGSAPRSSTGSRPTRRAARRRGSRG